MLVSNAPIRKMRLQVALSRAGVASRRGSAGIIKGGRVRVDGRVVTEPGFRVDISKEKIRCCGKAVSFKEKAYILLNKPRGIITTARDECGRRTVFDLMPKQFYNLRHVGRLDKDTSGLLLLTNDGELAYKLTHPKFGIERVYEALINGRLDERDRARLEKGVYSGGRRRLPCKIHILGKSIGKTLLRVVIREGRKRQIRNMFDRIGRPVIGLKRISFGPLKLKGLKAGAYRKLGKSEIERLKGCI